jgi:hypothetical protein
MSAPTSSIEPQTPEERLTEALTVSSEWLLFLRANGGPDMIASAHTKTAKEARELAETPDNIDEWADVVMCLIGTALQQEWSLDDLADAVMAKNAVNANRNWVQQPDGTWQHT